MIAGIQLELAGRHNDFAGIHCNLEQLVGSFVLVGPGLVGGGIHIEILPVGSLIESDPGEVSCSNPFVDDVLVGVVTEAVLNCELQVLDTLVDYILAVIPGSVEHSAVLGIDKSLLPRHVAVSLDLSENEVCPPEAADALVVVVNLVRHFAFCTYHIVDKDIGTTDVVI